MRRKVFDLSVLTGTPFISNDMVVEQGILILFPAGGGSVHVETYNCKSLTDGSPLDPQDATASDGTTTMTAITASSTLKQRTWLMVPPGVTGVRITVTGAGGSCRAVMYGADTGQ